MVPLEGGAGMNPTTVLIADDVAQVREDLRSVLTLAGGIEVVGEASNGQEAVELAESLRPDVVLMDLEMPGLGGCAATRRIKARRPDARVVALTVHGDEVTRTEAFQAGVDAFVVKGAALGNLVKAISEREE